MGNIQQQILFAHSGGGQDGPGEGSYDLVASLRKKLIGKYKIHFPIIEDPEAPTYEMWKRLIDKELKGIKNPIILIGHSFGGSMMLKYFSEEQPKVSVSAMFLISMPHWGESDWEVKDYELRKDFEKHLNNIDKIFLYHAENDEVVPFSHFKYYKSVLPQANLRVLNGNDHAFINGLPELGADIQSL